MWSCLPKFQGTQRVQMMFSMCGLFPFYFLWSFTEYPFSFRFLDSKDPSHGLIIFLTVYTFTNFNCQMSSHHTMSHLTQTPDAHDRVIEYYYHCILLLCYYITLLIITTEQNFSLNTSFVNIRQRWCIHLNYRRLHLQSVIFFELTLVSVNLYKS